MGNSSPSPNKTVKPDIIVCVSPKVVFPIQYKSNPEKIAYGLTLRDSSVLLARFVLFNKNKFKDVSVLELNAGTGLVSIVLASNTQSKDIVAT